MRFLANFTPKLRIGFIAMASVSLVGLIIGIAKHFGAHIEISTGQATLLISVCSLSFVIATLFATIHYKVDDEFVHINIAFIDMTGKRIRIENILNIAIIKNEMFISYLWKGPDPIIARIAISPKKFDQMKNLLKSKNKNIVITEQEDETGNSEQ